MLLKTPMPNQEKAAARKIKPVKAWAITTYRGRIISLGRTKEAAWESVPPKRPYFAKRVSESSSYLPEELSYRCIRVLISPL